MPPSLRLKQINTHSDLNINVGDGDDVMTVQTPTVGGTLDQLLPYIWPNMKAEVIKKIMDRDTGAYSNPDPHLEF